MFKKNNPFPRHQHDASQLCPVFIRKCAKLVLRCQRAEIFLGDGIHSFHDG